MNASQPPRLAVWLLERCGGSESLVGDLVERYRRGKSAAWLWRQVLAASMGGVARDIRACKLLAVRGVILGLAFLFLFQRFIQAPLSRMDDWLFVTGLADVRWAWPNQHVPGRVRPGGPSCTRSRGQPSDAEAASTRTWNGSRR